MNFFQKVCDELEDGRIAVLAIGESPVFSLVHLIANTLKIPYITIKWDKLNEEYKNIENLLDEADDEPKKVENLINIHPPANKIIKAIIDLIDFYKWDHITVLFQETTGLARIEDLVKLNLRKYYRNSAANSQNINPKFRVQVRQLSRDTSEWIYLIKDIKLSGSSHLVVDIQKRYLNKFLELSEEVGLLTSYFHFMFTTLDLAYLEYTPSANVTALQIFEPNDMQIRSLFAEFNLKNMVSHKPMFKYMPVKIRNF